MRLMKKPISPLAAVLALVLIALLIFFVHRKLASGRMEVTISQAQINAVLAKTFPQNKKSLKVVTLTYSEPRAVLITGTDQVRVSLKVKATIGISGLEKSYDGAAAVLTKIGYDSEKKQIYLQDAGLEDLSIPKIPNKYLEIAKTAATLAASQYFDKIPVYNLTEKDSAQSLARWLLRDVRIADQKIHFLFGLEER